MAYFWVKKAMDVWPFSLCLATDAVRLILGPICIYVVASCGRTSHRTAFYRRRSFRIASFKKHPLRKLLRDTSKVLRGVRSQKATIPRGVRGQKATIPRGIRDQGPTIPRGVTCQQATIPRGIRGSQALCNGVSPFWNVAVLQARKA